MMIFYYGESFHGMAKGRSQDLGKCVKKIFWLKILAILNNSGLEGTGANASRHLWLRVCGILTETTCESLFLF